METASEAMNGLLTVLFEVMSLSFEQDSSDGVFRERSETKIDKISKSARNVDD